MNQELCIFFARTMAFACLAFATGLILNKKYYKKALPNILEDSSLLLISGMMAIVTGSTLVYFHNVWEQNWTVLITLTGWGALIKGFFLLALPTTASFFKPLFSAGRIMKFGLPYITIIGVVFAYFGFYA